MRKRKAFQKLIATILAVIMVMSTAPIPASALEIEAGGDSLSPEAWTEPSEYGEDPLTAGAGMWVLEQLASGAVSYIGGMAMEEAMGQIFGKPPSEIDKLVTAFQALSADIKEIKSEIEALSAKIDQKDLKDALRDYGNFINAYSAVYEHLSASQVYCKGKPEMTKEFLTELYDVADPNFKVDSKGIIEATLSLGNYLTRPFKGSNYNPFGAFDQLDKFSNRWEHQGYAQRKAFREEALYTYIVFSTMAQLTCQTALADKSKTDLQREKAGQWLKQLKENAALVNAMQERCAVIEHPDLRIYRDTKLGKDLYHFKKTVEIATPYQLGDPELGKYITTIDGFRSHGILLPMARTSRFNREDNFLGFALSSQQPSKNMYKKLFDDYKADMGREVGLYHIFFDANKGAFTSPGSYPGKRFATNAYAFFGFGPFCYWEAHVMSNSAEFDRPTLIEARVNDRTISEITRNSTEMFYSPIYYYGKVDQGLLKLPEEEPTPEPADKISGMALYYELPHDDHVTLTVEEKTGYSYQWYVKTGEGGYHELPLANSTSYTLPPLAASMNGFQYICGFIPDSGLVEDYLSAAPVTLDLRGEGVVLPETVHLVHNAEDLEAALEKVRDGDWDGHTIKLVATIEYPKPITLLDRMLTLDFNGCTLRVSPASDAQPNVNPESRKPEIAAIYVASNSTLTTTGDGALNILANGVDYGVYAEGGSSVEEIGSVWLRGGGTAVHTSNNGFVTVNGFLRADGDKAVGVSCADGGHIGARSDITVSGEGSYGTFISSSNGNFSDVTVAGNITVSGQNSRGAYLDAETARLTVNGNVTVTDGLAGISAGQGEVTIYGSVKAPDSAITVRDGATVHVYGDVATAELNAVAVSAIGASLEIGGHVTSSGKGGTGITASAWDISDPAVGAQVTADGIISAATPLRIESLPVEESGRTEVTTKPDYLTFTDGINTVWAKSGSFKKPWTPTDNSSSSNGTGSSVGTQPAIPSANGAVQVSYTASNGTATLSLPTAKVNEIIEKSKGGEAILDLSKVGGTTAAQLPEDALMAFSKAGLDVAVKLPIGTVTLDEDAAASVAQQATGSNLSIELKQAATSSLTAVQKQAVKSGDIVLDISITSGTKKISTFDGKLTVSMPYNGSQPVAVWYLNDKGELEKLNCTFKNGVVSFKLDHLSLYVVGQDTAKPVWVNPFTDVKETDWFYSAVGFCAEKGITNGTSATTFSPNATLTRGQFITMLLKAYGIEPLANPTDNFDDAGSIYYTGYLAAAKAKGISNGVGYNKFAPEKPISRQEMFTLLYNALKSLNKLPTTDNGKTLADFIDSGDIASWATEAMIVLVKSGTVSGNGDKLDPTDGSTRAQMAQVLYNLLEK